MLALVGLSSDLEVSLAGIVIAWSAAALALAKSWAFPLLGSLTSVKDRAERWWAPPETSVRDRK